MPTYDYLCDDCGHTSEKFQSITAKPLRKCSNCGKMKLQRLIGTGAGIIFKGSGFYETDYRSESYRQGEKKEKPDTHKEKTEKKETKTSAKTESTSAKDTTPSKSGGTKAKKTA